MLLTAGSRLGTYEIVAPVGAGGMGEVYRAKDLRLGREVALKLLPAEMASDAGRLARFEREARTVAGLNHPNIVTLFSVEDEDGVRFLTMELVEGQSLDRHVAPGGMQVARVLELGIALADALGSAHEKGVVHRDLKPANVMLTREGRVKVLDFGLAKLAEAPSDPNQTQVATAAGPISTAGQVVGTVPYMAPEQIRGEAVDARTDLFALGILLFELATGQRPFAGATPADVSSAILRDAPAELRRVRRELPADLERLVSRCLEKTPRKRTQTALEVSNELRRIRRILERGEPEPAASHKVASIAVLPFVNRSREEEDEYFSDGLADELLNQLAKIRGLRVAARTSSHFFKGKDSTIAAIGQALNVATVLEGSVRKAGHRVRISVQLVKVSDGYHLWSESYDRTLEDIFAVQDDIAQSVVKELRSALLGEELDSGASGQVRSEVAKAAKGRATDAEAHRLYLLARHLIERSNREDMASGIVYLKQALERDPEFPLAWAELAEAFIQEANLAWTAGADGYARAREAVERALALEPDLAEGHARRGFLLSLHDRDWRGAEASYARALELAPGSAAVLRRAGMLSMELGRLEEGIERCRRAVELDPLSASCYSNLGVGLRSSGRLADAEQAFRKSLELAPQAAARNAFLSLTLLDQGRASEAMAEAMREADEGFRLWALTIIHHSMHNDVESDASLRELIEKFAGDSAYQIAEVYAARGEVNTAFEWLERAHVQGDPGLVETQLSTFLRSLHDDPRWGTFTRKLGFEG